MRLGSALAEGSTASATSWSFTFDAAVAHGLTVIGSIAFDASGGTLPVVTVTDTAGNTWTADPDLSVVSGSTVSTHLIYARVTSSIAAGDTLRIATDITRSRVAASLEYYDDPIGDMDQFATATGTSASVSAGPTPSTAQPRSLVFAGFGYGADRTFTAGGGFFSSGTVNSAAGAGNRGTANEWSYATTAGVKTATGTLDSSSTYSGVVAVFPLTPIDYSVAVDWDNDGDFDGTGEDVTSRVRGSEGISIQYGRDQARSLSPTQPGQASFTLDNRSRDYSPEFTASPLYGLVRPGRATLIQATWGAARNLYRGFLDAINLQPEKESRSVSVGGLDTVARLQEIEISTPLYEAIPTGRAIGLVLDAAGWPDDLRDLDDGATWIPWWWEDATTASEAIGKIVSSEGPPAFVSVDGDGRFVFRDRHHRISRTASTTVQATFRDSGAEPLFSAPLGYDAGWRDILNDVSVKVDTRQPGETNVEIWTYGQDFVLRGGQVVQIRAEFSNPCKDIGEPGFLTIDNGGSGLSDVQVSMDRTSGQSVTLTFYGVGDADDSSVITGPTSPSALITGSGVRLVGREVAVVSSNTVRVTDADSISQHGRKGIEIPAPWCNANDAEAICELTLGQRSDRLPIVTPQLRSGLHGDTTRLTHMLSRDLSDRVHLVDDETGMDADLFVEQIRHDVSGAGAFHTTTFGLEKARDQPAAVFVLDESELDDGVLGYRGVQPDDWFKIGTSVLGTGKLAY